MLGEHALPSHPPVQGDRVLGPRGGLLESSTPQSWECRDPLSLPVKDLQMLSGFLVILSDLIAVLEEGFPRKGWGRQLNGLVSSLKQILGAGREQGRVPQGCASPSLYSI